MDRFDIDEMLNGFNTLSLDVEGLEKVDISEVVAGLLLHYEQLRQHGKDDYVEFLQREGQFSAFENVAAELVAGYEIDTQAICEMPEPELRAWLIGYLKLLSRERRENERSSVAKKQHKGLGW